MIAILLIADLGFFHRSARPVKPKEAGILSLCWIALALLFNLFIYVFFGSEKALQFLTGFIIEKSLSIDNLFVFLLIFLYFRIPATYQHKILYWGILGALVFRISLILMGVALVTKFHWLFYVFGAFLLFSGLKFALQRKEKDISQSFLLKIFKRILPVTEEGKGRFFLKVKGRWMVTSLFLAHLMIETADIVFALDSIPAIFAITTDPFIIYTSNVFAILGLRSLYFLLAAWADKLHYLKFGLGAILIFIGAKMLLADAVTISVAASLGIVVLILGLTTLLSFKARKLQG